MRAPLEPPPQSHRRRGLWSRETQLEQWLKRLLFYAHRVGRHRAACVFIIIVLTIGLRCALLPWVPRPRAYVQDEFAYLLGADTFVSGRLANPAHPLWQFFESIHMIAQPSYSMKYQPGQSAFLALGQVLFGDPYWGVVISTGLMTGAVCWMMQGLLLPGWALIGGLFTAAAFGGGHYWIQSYWGGSVAALASALMVGAFARIVRRGRHRYIWLFAASSALGLLTRPYETGVLAMLLTTVLLVICFRSHSWMALRKMALPYASVMAVWACFQLYYDWRITGNALKLPYLLHDEQYAVTPSFWMLPLRTVPRPQDPAIYTVHWRLEKGQYATLRAMGWVQRAGVLLRRSVIGDVCGIHTTVPDLVGALLYVLVFAPMFWFSRRIRFLTASAAVLALSTCLVVWTFLHYLAPFLVVTLALIFLLISYMRSFNVGGRRVGNIIVAIILLYLPFKPLLLVRGAIVEFNNRRQDLYVNDRDNITAALQRAGGRHVVIVHYQPESKKPRVDWVYNSANIDAQAIVWARDRGRIENRKLLAYYHDRHFWMLYADEWPVRIAPYRE